MPLSAPKPEAYFPEPEVPAEPTTSWIAEEAHDPEAHVDQWHELPCQFEPGGPEFEHVEDPDASFHEQLAVLVRALGSEDESKPQANNGADQATSELTDETEADWPKFKITENKPWSWDARLVSLTALRNAFDARARGFVAGFGASIAAGATAFALAGGMDEPPAMASMEAQVVSPLAIAESTAIRPETTETTSLPLRASISDEEVPSESEQLSAGNDSSEAREFAAAMADTVIEPIAKPEPSSESPLIAAPSPSPADGVVKPAEVEEATDPQQEDPAKVAMSFETTVQSTPDAVEPSMPAVEGSNSEGETAYALKYANLRAGPNNAAPVLAVIPEGSAVEVVQCEHWCEVIAQGQRGWVYKDLITSATAVDQSSTEASARGS